MRRLRNRHFHYWRSVAYIKAIINAALAQCVIIVIDLEYTHPPAIWRTYVAAVRNALRRRETTAAPDRARAFLTGLAIDHRRVADYDALCSYGDERTIALTYPHVLAFALQMAIMTHREFPLSILGLIHTHNRIRRYRTVRFDEPLNVCVEIGNWRELESAREFDLDTHLYAGNNGEALVWSERSTMRARRSSARQGNRRRVDESPPELEFATCERWSMPANLGRRYARIAGDYNPIHLGRLPARLFGFTRPIATGMWLQARAAAALDPMLDREAVEMTIAFKKPVPLPAERDLVLDDSNSDDMTFALVDRPSRTLHLRGRFRTLPQSIDGSPEEADHADS